MSTLDDEKLESILYETSNVEVYKIPAPFLKRVDDHLQEHHDINLWKLTKENLIFKGILRVKEQEFFANDDETDDESDEEASNDREKDNISHPQGQAQLKSPEQESLERFKLVVEFVYFESGKVWESVTYVNLSPQITTSDDTSFYSIQPVSNSPAYSAFVEIEDGTKVGIGFKFPNRVESSNFQLVLNNYIKDSSNYTKMIINNRKLLGIHGDHNTDQEDLVDRMNSVQFTDTLSRNSQFHVREVESSGDNDDDDDDDFGDFVGQE